MTGTNRKSQQKAPKETFQPVEVELPTAAPSSADQEYHEKTLRLKDYLRKKIIQAQIFGETQEKTYINPKTGASFKIAEKKNPLSTGEITYDDAGKPLKVQKIEKFTKNLVNTAKISIP